MILRQRTHWFRMLFIWNGSVLPRILPQLAILTVFSLGVLLIHGKIYAYKVNLNPTIFTLIGIALAIFLGFCNTASYDRYWEGRKLWGIISVETRSLTRTVATLAVNPKGNSIPETEKLEFIRKVAAFSWILNNHLRSIESVDKVSSLLGPELTAAIRDKQFKPVVLLFELGKQAGIWLKDNKIDSVIAAQINVHLNELSTALGGCERILNTPLPFAYHILLHRTVYIYCFLLPFGLVDQVGWMMPLLVMFISYTFISLDAIVAEIGEPFGTEPNDLALNAICEAIEYSILEQSGVEQEPLTKHSSYIVT